ncbi:MAG: DNA replication and repair protein RecF [Psychroflexus sp.]|nr:DNA replication and repair protein RecF [Psychroflexus sp.]
MNKLSLLNYKNFSQLALEFNPHINCLVGQNGIGKTNVLDAIYHLAFGKSYYNPISGQNILHGEEFFVVDGALEISQKSERIVVSYKKGQKKVLKRNSKIYDKMSDHIGLIPLVIITPTDRDLILEGSETRRKFMDGVIAQGDKQYLDTILRYSKLLSQRNALLKYFTVNRTFNSDSLQVYNDQMNDLAKVIYDKRKAFVEIFEPILQKRYEEISHGRETISLHYKSQLEDDKDLNALFAEAQQKDLQRQYSTVGVHKDDLRFRINSHSVKKFGSQGQQKSYLIALKFAQYDFLKEIKGFKPIVLLDDIFDKLDESRVAQIVQMVTREDMGQLFISDTHAERTEEVVKASTENYKMINLSEIE